MRAAPVDNWDDTLPAADRERYAAAWQAHQCCADCKEWHGADEDRVGACGRVKLAAFLTPEDFTCDEFVAK